MAILARLWFHYCSASGWFRAERTGLSTKTTRSRGSGGQRELKQGRRDLAIQNSCAFQARILDARKDALPRRMNSATDEFDALSSRRKSAVQLSCSKIPRAARGSTGEMRMALIRRNSARV